jgi:hypothetical protein
VLAQITTLSATEIVNNLLPSVQVDSLRIASLSLLYLRYQMFGKVKSNKNPNLVPIEQRYEALNATDFEIEESIKIGKKLYKQIQEDVLKHVQNITISESYFLGLHIGDGSFSFSTYFSTNHKSFKARFTWNLTDCMENKLLLVAVKEFLQSKGIHFTNSCYRYFDTYLQLQVTGVDNCLELVNFFEQLGAEKYLSP